MPGGKSWPTAGIVVGTLQAVFQLPWFQSFISDTQKKKTSLLAAIFVRPKSQQKLQV